ncbi:peptidoglycan DD-metalloendopeptidase family protein [Microcella daejeonensis]|uniref:peptidoglycan DD-metalloendopeptidase family protein n=1 Tax=Microcella daejeonensis TaxID=2994971 RepID=UPI00226E4042|nr:peptidoglycan DD-metalloendopeptidase family protein [Microcella daejeonensis]WAB82889.1 peptidoglycan DD-metalloendopeptidase family protein [Microcella daejeonensis]
MLPASAAALAAPPRSPAAPRRRPAARLAAALLPLLALGLLAALPTAEAAAAPGALAAMPSGAHPAARSLGTAPDPGWRWPVDGPRLVERPFLAPPTPYAAGHRGVDLAAPAAPPGEPAVVRSPVDGVVHFAGRVVDRGVVTVRAGPLLVTVEPVTASVAAGDEVVAGEQLGVLEPGHCARPCVHLGVREAGLYVSPMRWLGGLQRAVLLPLAAPRG